MSLAPIPVPNLYVPNQAFHRLATVNSNISIKIAHDPSCTQLARYFVPWQMLHAGRKAAWLMHMCEPGVGDELGWASPQQTLGWSATSVSSHDSWGWARLGQTAAPAGESWVGWGRGIPG